MTSKIFEFFIITLIFLYTLIVFAQYALDDKTTSDEIDTDQLKQVSYNLKIAEIFILTIFIIEISLRVYVEGFKVIFIWFKEFNLD